VPREVVILDELPAAHRKDRAPRAAGACHVSKMKRSTRRSANEGPSPEGSSCVLAVDIRLLEFDRQQFAPTSPTAIGNKNQQRAAHCLKASCQTDCEPLSPILYTNTTDPIARTTICDSHQHGTDAIGPQTITKKFHLRRRGPLRT